MGFLFVERIVDVEPGRRARGRLTVPAGVPLPACLVAEAAGQLAASAAMAHVGFRRRPVAAIAGRARFHGAAPPGAVVLLEAALDGCDESATTYAASARRDDGATPILELERCLGPMLPMEEFDDADLVRSRFEALCGDGSPLSGVDGAAGYGGLAPLDGESGRTRRAQLRVPSAAPFFADHFPRNPIFPGTLLLDALLCVANELAREALPAPPLERLDVRDVKLRRFVKPGDVLELSAKLKSSAAGQVRIALVAARGSERVASAQVQLRAGAPA